MSENVKRNSEGYLEDSSEWTEDIAREIASELDIELTDKHFEVLNFIRPRSIMF